MTPALEPSDQLIPSQHITLIGMPAVGKSTLGKALAKSLGWKFIDTDDLLIKQIDMDLQTFIDRHGSEHLNKEEERAVLSIDLVPNSVISTGGSVVYQENSMTFLKNNSTVVYLHDTLDNIKRRMPNMEQRGITGLAEKGLDGIYAERTALYEHYKDVTVDVFPFHKTNIIASITDVLKLSPYEST